MLTTLGLLKAARTSLERGYRRGVRNPFWRVDTKPEYKRCAVGWLDYHAGYRLDFHEPAIQLLDEACRAYLRADWWTAPSHSPHAIYKVNDVLGKAMILKVFDLVIAKLEAQAAPPEPAPEPDDEEQEEREEEEVQAVTA